MKASHKDHTACWQAGCRIRKRSICVREKASKRRVTSQRIHSKRLHKAFRKSWNYRRKVRQQIFCYNRCQLGDLSKYGRKFRQQNDNKSTTNGQQINNKSTTNGQQINTNKNVKNGDNVKNDENEKKKAAASTSSR